MAADGYATGRARTAWWILPASLPAQYAEVAALNTEVMNVGRYLMDKKPGELYHAGLAASEKSNATLAATFFCSKIEDSAVFAGLPAAHVILSTFTDDDGTPMWWPSTVIRPSRCRTRWN